MIDRNVEYVDWSGRPTLSAVLDRRAEMTPDSRFVTCGAVSLSYEEAVARATRAAAGLAGVGVRKGDAVALMLPNCLEFLDLWFGAAMLGAPIVPINMALKGDGLRYVVEHSDPKVAVVDDSVAEVYRSSVTGGGPGRLFMRGEVAPGWEPLGTLLASGPAAFKRPDLGEADIVSLLYTSGTTGRSKGALNCNRAYLTAGYEFAHNYVRVRPDDVLYTSLPLFHVNAQMLTTVGSLLTGRPMVLAPRFSASQFMNDVRQAGATVFNYIGAMLTMIAKQPATDDDRDNPVRLAIGGAAPAPLWWSFEERFNLQILEIYGLTETATFCLGSPPDDIRAGKLGLPVSWAQVKVVRPDNTPAPDGEAGELLVRSTLPNVLFRGYHKDPEATQLAMAGSWFRTGDRVRRDTDGYYVFLDRLKDTIRRRGENISTYDVEQIVNSHPSVAESAAVGVPSDLGEDDVLIAIVPVAGGDPIDMGELIEFCRTRMAKFMVPRYVRLVESLPKTATERVQKFVLRELGTGGAWDRDAITSEV